MRNDIYTVQIQPPYSNTTKRHPAGRFMIQDGHLRHLEDYHGILEHAVPEGPVTTETAARILALKQNPHLHVISREEHRQGQHLDGLPEAEFPGKFQQAVSQTPMMPARRPSSFHYHHGEGQPHVVEIHEGRHTLDGNDLSPAELHNILANVQQGKATIRYNVHSTQDAIQKMERVFRLLSKEEDVDPATALQHIQAAVKAGHLDPKIEAALRRHIYEDPMVQGIGNKYAYNEFIQKPRPGVHASIDLNDFRGINNTYGHHAGDEAIKAFGKAAREAMDETIPKGPGGGKLFRAGAGEEQTHGFWRSGGDEAAAFLPTPEHAATFARKLRSKLEAIPPVGGTHQLSASIGFGHDPKSADEAQYHAKAAKTQHMVANNLKPGQAPSFAHSLLQGSEGPIPLSEPHPTASLQPPPATMRPTTPAPAPIVTPEPKMSTSSSQPTKAA